MGKDSWLCLGKLQSNLGHKGKCKEKSKRAHQAEEKAKAEAAAKEREESEKIRKAAAAARVKAEDEAQAKRKAEAELKAKQEAEAKERARIAEEEAKERARIAAEEKRKADEEARKKAEEVARENERLRLEAERQAKLEAEARARAEALAKEATIKKTAKERLESETRTRQAEIAAKTKEKADHLDLERRQVSRLQQQSQAHINTKKTETLSPFIASIDSLLTKIRGGLLIGAATRQAKVDALTYLRELCVANRNVDLQTFIFGMKRGGSSYNQDNKNFNPELVGYTLWRSEGGISALMGEMFKALDTLTEQIRYQSDLNDGDVRSTRASFATLQQQIDVRLTELQRESVAAQSPPYLARLEAAIRQEEKDRQIALEVQAEMVRKAEVARREAAAREEQQRQVRAQQERIEEARKAQAERQAQAARSTAPSLLQLRQAPATSRAPEPSLQTSRQDLFAGFGAGPSLFSGSVMQQSQQTAAADPFSAGVMQRIQQTRDAFAADPFFRDSEARRQQQGFGSTLGQRKR